MSKRNLDDDLDPASYNYGPDPDVDSGTTSLWAGIAIAALLIIGGFLYFSSSRSQPQKTGSAPIVLVG